MDDATKATILSICLPPITAIVGWFVGMRKRRNDAIGYMQMTIDNLAAKNDEYMNQITKLRGEVVKLQQENAKLQLGQIEMQKKLEEISNENAALRAIIEQRTITAKAAPTKKTR